jgi:type IV pilus assembly protein PilB
VNIVNLIIAEAAKRSASDIHVEPYETEFRVRLRIDVCSMTLSNCR